MAAAPAPAQAQGAHDASPSEPSSPADPHTGALILWRGFGDVGWQKTDMPDTANAFSLGQLTLYPTANVSEHLSVLAEIVFKEGGPNRITVDLERILLRYSLAECLALSAGRFHTAIGYYNTAYHHSSWLQTTIERPLPFAFKGPLPIHDVGVSARGSFKTSVARMEYAAEIGNGRSSLADTSVQNYRDDNEGKAFNIAFAVMPNASPNLRVGVSAYRDASMPMGGATRSESIVAGYLVYTSPIFELLNEALMFRLAGGGAPGTTSSALYSQISRAFGPWRPYARVEHADTRVAVTPSVTPGRRTLALGGLRYDFTEMAALKFEYRHLKAGATDVGNGVAVNASFAF